MRFTGTSSGTMGLPAGPYELRMIELSKYKNGKSIEHWTLMDMRDVMKFMPQQGSNSMNKMNPDNSKMKSK